MSSFVNSMTRMAVLSDEQMTMPWKWRPEGEVLEIRDIFHRSLEAENAQATAVAAIGSAETVAALVLAQRAAGDLCGLLAGQPDDILGRAPSPGEWSLRETMGHVIETEAGFRVKTLWAVDRTSEDPIEPPPELRSHLADVSGDASSWIVMLLEQRATTDAEFVRVGSNELDRPSTWVSHPVDARFRLHRPASHLIEHTNQCEKVLHAIGHDPGEARQLVRAIWAARGGHERLSDLASLARLDEELAARVDSLGL
jgi:hypothetical protein